MIDLLIVALFLIICIVSYQRGFFATLLTITSGALSFVFVYFLASPFGLFLEKQGILNGFHDSIKTGVTERLATSGGSIVEVLSSYGIPESWSQGLAAQASGASTQTAVFLADQLTHLLSGVLAIVLLFLFFQVIVRLFLRRLAHGVNKIPLIGTVNRIGGFFLGALWGLLIVYLTSLLMTALAPSVPVFASWLQQSAILQRMSETPLFMKAFESVVKVKKP